MYLKRDEIITILAESVYTCSQIQLEAWFNRFFLYSLFGAVDVFNRNVKRRIFIYPNSSFEPKLPLCSENTLMLGLNIRFFQIIRFQIEFWARFSESCIIF